MINNADTKHMANDLCVTAPRIFRDSIETKNEMIFKYIGSAIYKYGNCKSENQHKIASAATTEQVPVA
jgi:glutathionyl-hydroquinone reductase